MTNSPLLRRMTIAAERDFASGPDQEKTTLAGILAALPDQMGDLVGVVELPDWTFVYLNRAGRALLGLDSESQLGLQSLTDLVPQRCMQKLKEVLEAKTPDELSSNLDTEFLAADGLRPCVSLTLNKCGPGANF